MKRGLKSTICIIIYFSKHRISQSRHYLHFFLHKFSESAIFYFPCVGTSQGESQSHRFFECLKRKGGGGWSELKHYLQKSKLSNKNKSRTINST